MRACAPPPDLCRPRPSRLIAAGLVGLCLLSPIPSTAQTPDPDAVRRQLDEIRGDLERQKAEHDHLSTEARKLAEEEAELRAATISAAEKTQNLEDRLLRLESDLSELTKREAKATRALEGKAGQHVDILMALQRLAATPPEIIVALPRGPRDQLRTATILKAALPAVDQHAKLLRKELRDIVILRGRLQANRRDISSATDALFAQQQEMERLLSRKHALTEQIRAAATDSARDLAALAAKADTLADLLRAVNRLPRLNIPLPRRKPVLSFPGSGIAPPEPLGAAVLAVAPRAKPKPARPEPVYATAPSPAAAPTRVASLVSPNVLLGETAKSIRDFKGKIPMPARGRVAVAFGDRVETGGPVQGVKSQGIEVATRPGAQVVAPFDGRVVYAGPFRRYRHLLIIEHDDGYHSLVAGLGRLDSLVGQWLLTGEPIGVMGDQDPKLYYEMRREGKPFNPLPWLASRKDKVSG